MATSVNISLGGIPSTVPPANIDEMFIELNFDRDKGTFVKSFGEQQIEVVAELNKQLLKIIEDAKAGLGKGVFVGPEYKMEIQQGSTTNLIFDGYVDLVDDAEFGEIKSNVKIKEKLSIDALNDLANSFTFEYLFKETGDITEADFDFIPYVLNSVPNYKEAAIVAVGLFMIQEQLKGCITQITMIGQSLANPFEITAVIRLITYIAYLVLLLIAVVKMVKTIVTLIIQPVKYHAGMYALKMCQKASEYMGYTFKSPDFLESSTWVDLFVLPEKFANPTNPIDDRILGFTTPVETVQEGFYKGTFGDLLEALKRMIKGKIVITADKTIYLVTQNYNVSVPEYQLPDLYQPNFKLNANEIKSNYLIEFATDTIDKNTIQNYIGTRYQVLTQPISSSSDDINLLKGLEIASIPFALATRKETLTTPEKIVDEFLDVFDGIINGLINGVNTVIDVVNTIIDTVNNIIDALDFVGINVDWEIPTIPTLAPVSLGSLIDNRVGMLNIEIDSTGVAKIFLMKKGIAAKFNKIYADNSTTVSAKNLWQFHKVISFVPSSEYPKGNQWIINTFENVPFEFINFLQVSYNNRIFDALGNEAEIDNLKWYFIRQYAEMVVRFNETYDTTRKEIYIEANGS